MKFAIIYNPEIPAAPEVKDNLRAIIHKRGIECEILDINNMKKMALDLIDDSHGKEAKK